MYLPLFVGVLCWSLLWYVLLYVLSTFAVLTRKRELIALLLLSFGCLVTVNVLWLFLTVPWAGLQCVIVVFLIILTILWFCGWKHSKAQLTVVSQKMEPQLKVSSKRLMQPGTELGAHGYKASDLFTTQRQLRKACSATKACLLLIKATFTRIKTGFLICIVHLPVHLICFIPTYHTRDCAQSHKC